MGNQHTSPTSQPTSDSQTEAREKAHGSPSYSPVMEAVARVYDGCTKEEAKAGFTQEEEMEEEAKAGLTEVEETNVELAAGSFFWSVSEVLQN